MKSSRRTLRVIACFGCAAAWCCAPANAGARPARCLTTDDGSYSCQFRLTDHDGSFEISARGKPTYLMNMMEPGIAFGFVNLGTRNISLPGRFQRKGACWVNDVTRTRICAW